MGPSAPAALELFQLDVTAVMTEPMVHLGVPSAVEHSSGGVLESG